MHNTVLGMATHLLNVLLWAAMGYGLYRLARWLGQWRRDAAHTRQRPGG